MFFFPLSTILKIDCIILHIIIMYYSSHNCSCETETEKTPYLEMYSKWVSPFVRKTIHLWYLSEDLTGLAFFSDRVSDTEKQAMVDALKKPKLQENVGRVDPKSVTAFQTMTLSNFVTENSLHLFTAMRIDPACITGNPSAWSQCPEYVSAKQKIMGHGSEGNQ